MKLDPALYHRIEQLLREGKVRSAPKRRELTVLKLLDDGLSVAEVAAQVSRTEGRIRQIVRASTTDGIEALVTRMEKIYRERGVSTETSKPRRAGRPGHETLEAASNSREVGDLPVVEIGAIVFTRAFQMIVVSIRDRATRREKIGPGRSLAAKVVAILDDHSLAEHPVVWTTLVTFDSIMADIFAGLREQLSQLDSAPAQQLTSMHPALAQFQHLVLWAGDRAAMDEAAEELGLVAGKVYELPDAEALVLRLEQLLHLLRQKMSWIGLCPCHWLLYDELNNAEESGFGEGFLWQVSDEIDFCLKRWYSVFTYFAIQGWVFELAPPVWRSFPYKERTSAGALSHRSRIVVEDYQPDTGALRLTVHPLPEFNYQIRLNCSVDPEEMAQMGRQLVRTTPAATRFFYAARASTNDDLRETIVLPAQFFSERDQARAKQGVGLTLVPRHLVTPPPPLPWRDCERAIGEIPPQVTRRKEIEALGQTEEYLVLNAALLIDGLLEGWRDGIYLKEFGRMSWWQGELFRRVLRRAGPEPLGWLMRFAKLNFEPLAGGADSGPLEAALSPSAEVGRALAALLENFDADFLVRYIPQRFADELDVAVSGWQAEVAAILAEASWANGSSNQSGRPNRTASTKKRTVDLEDYRSLALGEFVANERRVVRMAIENAQRLHLAGLTPVAFAMIKIGDLLRRWEGFLSLRIRRKASDASAAAQFDEYDDDQEVRAGMVVKPARRNTTNRET